jgi:hypothetical protein
MKSEPVMIAASVVAVLELFIAMALTMGWISWNSEQMASFNNFVVALAALAVAVIPLAGAYFARAKVTPIADPRGADGVELVAKE